MSTGENNTHPETRDSGTPSVDNASEHARRLTATALELLALAAELEGRPTPPPLPATDGPLNNRELAQLARNVYNHRRLRAKVFDDPDLFGEPAWDLLLDLFVAAREGKRLPVTSACIGASVPTTTALRWIAMLEARGLVLRENDANDARRIFVRLTPEADARMAEYFIRSGGERRSEPSPRPQEAEPGEGAAGPFAASK